MANRHRAGFLATNRQRGGFWANRPRGESRPDRAGPGPGLQRAPRRRPGCESAGLPRNWQALPTPSLLTLTLPGPALPRRGPVSVPPVPAASMLRALD
jgi:hypothetical protein